MKKLTQNQWKIIAHSLEQRQKILICLFRKEKSAELGASYMSQILELQALKLQLPIG